jgi:hypothetical protein
MNEYQFVQYVAKAITDYSVQVIICAVFIVIAVLEHRSQESKFTAMFNKLMENYPKEHGIDEDSKYDSFYLVLSETLDSLRDVTQANRVSLFMYHNGGKNLVGIPFQKMSNISESISAGLSSISPISQNIPRSQYSSVCNQLKVAGHFWVNDIKGIEATDGSLYSLLSERMTRSMYVSAIYDKSNASVIGFVMAEFIHAPVDNDIDRIEDELSKVTIKISGIMSVNDSWKCGGNQ